MRPKILVTDRIHDVALEEARKFADVDVVLGLKPEELAKRIQPYDALIVRSETKVTREVIENSNLKIIGRAGVGLDNIDVEAAKEKGIAVVNSPEASTIAVAELVMGSLIALLRHIPHAHHSMKECKWERSRFMGMELYGKKLGIIGFGRIGREVADRANAFGMRVQVYDPMITIEDARESNCELVELDELLKTSDIVTLHVPLTPETRNMINEEKLRLMKKNAVLVNIARGGIVDEKALKKALEEKRLRGAVLDVYCEEPPRENIFKDLDNVITLPHLGASTNEAQINAGTVVVEKIRNFFRKG